MEFVELTDIVGLVPLLKESHVDERDLKVIGESPKKLGGRDLLYISDQDLSGKNSKIFAHTKKGRETKLA